MRAWRIYDHNAAYAKQADFDPTGGEGGLHGHGRWHHKGHPITYAASSPSLALLEILVHIDPRRFREQTLLELDIPEEAETVTRAQLVQLLRDAPEGDPQAGTRAFGTTWLQEQRSLALVVPSTVVPFEQNIILNPHHPNGGNVRIVSRERITLDDRLLRNLVVQPGRE